MTVRLPDRLTLAADPKPASVVAVEATRAVGSAPSPPASFTLMTSASANATF